MKKKTMIVILVLLVVVLAGVLIDRSSKTTKTGSDNMVNEIHFGKKKQEGFSVNDTLKNGDKTYHFSTYIPASYDKTKKYDLYVVLPGWEGLYFQGVGSNLQERFPFEALKYNDHLIVISPQLDDWNDQSADDTIYLTKYMQSRYNIDKTFISGVSGGGGETLSLVLGKDPALYDRALHVISKWDGSLNVLAKSKLPLYIVIGEHDSYYGSAPAKKAYRQLYDIYQDQGLAKEAIDTLVTLDVKPDSYFNGQDQHMGGMRFAYEKSIMSWLLKD